MNAGSLDEGEVMRPRSGSFIGPESFAIINGSLYTGVVGGKIHKMNLTDGTFTEFTRITSPCCEYFHLHSALGNKIFDFDPKDQCIRAPSARSSES